MSTPKKRNRQRATFIGAVIGLMLIFTFVISLLNPGLGSNSDSSDNFPTITPFGTLPPPTKVIIPTPDDNPQLAGDLPYIHTSGFFQTLRPAGSGWTIDEGEEIGTSDNLYPKVLIQNRAQLAVIHNYVQPGISYETAERLNDVYLDSAYFAAAWSAYDSWIETSRNVSGDTVTATFDLVADNNQYLGEDTTRLEDGWLYVTRLVVPANNPDLLTKLHALVLPNFIGYRDLQTLPTLWPTYTDQEMGFALKHPSHWEQVAGGTGRPVTFKVVSSQNEILIRVLTEPDRAIETMEDAEAWLNENEPTAEVLDSTPIEREFGSGYQLAYSYRDEAGDPHSGTVILLNNDTNTLFIADLQFETPDINALDVESIPPVNQQDVQALAQGFIVLPAQALEPVIAPTDIE